MTTNQEPVTLTVEGDATQQIIDSLTIAAGVAAGADKARRMLTSVRIQSDGQTVTITSTDSYVLWQEEFIVHEAPVFDVLLPGADFKKALAAGNVKDSLRAKKLTVSMSQGVATIGKVLVSFESTPEASFPNVERIIAPLNDYPAWSQADGQSLPVGLGENGFKFLLAVTKTLDSGVLLQPHPTDALKPIKVHVRPGVTAIVTAWRIK
jgi:hypothetical protein